MSDGFTIGAASNAPTIFSCPKCNETIDSTAETCRFCGQPVDHAAAQSAAELLSKINQACSDASYLKSTAWALPVFFLLRFVPFLSMLGGIGFAGLLFAIPIWALVWSIKYRSITSEDADFKKARQTVTMAGIVVGTLLVFMVGIEIVSFVVMARR